MASTRVRGWSLGILAGLAMVIAIGGSISGARGGVSGGSQENPWQRQEERSVRSDGGIVLDAPSEERSPVVSAEDATETARKVSAYVTEKSVVSKTFAMYSNLSATEAAAEGSEGKSRLLYEDVPVWVITFDQACVTAHGGYASEFEACGNTEWNVVVNAETGEYIQGFSDR